MRIRSLVAMFMLVLLLGVTAFMVNSDVGTPEDANTTEESETPHETEINEDSTESDEDTNNQTDVVEVDNKVDEIHEKVKVITVVAKELTDDESDRKTPDFEKLTKKIEELYKELENIKDVEVKVVDSFKIDGEDGWGIYTIIPDVKSKIIKGKDLDVGELSVIITALKDKIDSDLTTIVDSNNIRVLKKDINSLSKKFLDSTEVDKLTEKIVKLTKELSADSDELSKQIKELLKNYQMDANGTFSVGGVKVIKVDPSGSANVEKDLKAIEDMKLHIKKLTKDSDSDALVDAIRKQFEKEHPDATIIIEIDGAKVLEINPDTFKKTVDDSNEISELKERVNQLEDKIDELIQKLDADDAEPSENQK